MSGRFSRKTIHTFLVVGGGTAGFAAYATIKGDAKFYRNVIMPTMRLLSAEAAHKFAIKTAKYGLLPRMGQIEKENLKCKVFGLDFSSPIGLAAGFDKDGEAALGLLKIGFGFVEIGSVTPLPQLGNEKPRVFRLQEDGAIINRYGFNSAGHEVVHRNLSDLRELPGLLGVNLGKNKTSPDPVNDYVLGVEKFGNVADYLVINISSPNTPGLRDMQGRKKLQELIEQVVATRDKLPKRIPLLVKIAPDLTDLDKADIAAVVAKPRSGVDGLIVTNTTITRPDTLKSKNKTETGGLSGEPLKDLSTEVIRDMYRLTSGRLPIVGVGGVSRGKDAFDKIRAGASLVQFYTALAYHGPPLVNEVKRELSEILKERGYRSVGEAVGADHRQERKNT